MFIRYPLGNFSQKGRELLDPIRPAVGDGKMRKVVVRGWHIDNNGKDLSSCPQDATAESYCYLFRDAKRMTTPKVFISYSHDTPEHKQWVMTLATKLVAYGVEVLLDMWELGPGDDIALFMERGLREADRVLMVCTPTYVSKGESGRGGVGYEKTIMTADYMQNVDSRKVIPIIRQAGTSLVPAFLGTKYFLDFSTDEKAEYNFDQLARELHGKPLYVKPQLGVMPNFDTKTPVAPTLAEDPLIKAMKVVMRVYESESSSHFGSQKLIAAARNTGMSRTYFEQIFRQLIERGLVDYHQVLPDLYSLTDTGRAFAVSQGLDQF